VPVVLFVAGLGAAVLFMLGIGRAYWNRRVAKWADEHALTLLDFRGAGFFEGPRAFRRSDNQFAFRVDRGCLRSGTHRLVELRELLGFLADRPPSDSLGRLSGSRVSIGAEPVRAQGLS
jgi:hypothetical protein